MSAFDFRAVVGFHICLERNGCHHIQELERSEEAVEMLNRCVNNIDSKQLKKTKISCMNGPRTFHQNQT